MKHLFTLALGMLCSVVAFSQAHTFTYADAPKNHVGIDTVYGTVPSSIPSIPDGAHHTWDLSNVILGNYEYHAEFTAETGFANATHGNKIIADLAPGMSFEYKQMFAVESSGINVYGERYDRQELSLASQTGNPMDSIIILKQDVVYSTPLMQLPYPVTMGAKWSTTFNSTIDMQLTLNLLSLNKVPAQRKSIVNNTNEVIGWGAMRIKRQDGKPSGTKPVLMVKTTISVLDSLYLNGMPAPQPLLNAIGVSQGQTSVVYQKSFYRQEEIIPLTNITYSDATFTSVEDVNMHSQRLPYPDNVNDISRDIIASVFPNPSNGDFTINIPEMNNDTWTYRVTDMTGKVLRNNTITSVKTNVRLQSEIAGGNYIITILQNSVPVSGLNVSVQ